MTRKIKMCVVNHIFVEDIQILIGSQMEIMGNIGISWNSWIKIVGGLPIRLSVGQRLCNRILENAHLLPRLKQAFPPLRSNEAINIAAFENAFLRPPPAWYGQMLKQQQLRSVRRAMALRDMRHGVEAPQIS